MFKFNKVYFTLTLLLLLAEVLIAMYMRDAMIRPYGGDLLVVILLYCFVKSFVNTPVFSTAIGVLIFAYLVEISQYFYLTQLLGLQHSQVANLLLGSSFSLTDMLAYTLGVGLVLVADKININLKMSLDN
jgi:DNA integrity scanning protein DisA with diadenylate cyclase activity